VRGEEVGERERGVEEDGEREEEDVICLYDMWGPLESERSFTQSHSYSTKQTSRQYLTAAFSKSHSSQQLFQKPQPNQTHPYKYNNIFFCEGTSTISFTLIY
jgi:hypothetical protein